MVLAKYLEHTHAGAGGVGVVAGKRVLETGAGTGLVGLACAALGAAEVVLTDLPYALGNLEANVRRNAAALAGAGASSGVGVRVEEGDWFQPPGDALGPLDLIVAADVVWLDELVPALAGYLKAVLDRPGSRHAGACTLVLAVVVGGWGGGVVTIGGMHGPRFETDHGTHTHVAVVDVDRCRSGLAPGGVDG